MTRYMEHLPQMKRCGGRHRLNLRQIFQEIFKMMYCISDGRLSLRHIPGHVGKGLTEDMSHSLLGIHSLKYHFVTVVPIVQ